MLLPLRLSSIKTDFPSAFFKAFFKALIEEIFCFATFLIGIYLCGQTAKDVGMHDHSAIVWDEFVGLFITFAFVPVSLISLAIGFVLFRVFDILKPWPISLLDKHVHGGFGIMLDDVIAGLFACACLHGLLFYGVW